MLFFVSVTHIYLPICVGGIYLPVEVCVTCECQLNSGGGGSSKSGEEESPSSEATNGQVRMAVGNAARALAE